MRRSTREIVRGLAARLPGVAATAILGIALCSPAVGEVKYTVTDLGTFAGGGSSYAHGVNNSGQVVGYAVTAGGDSHAFLYQGGTMTDLGTLGGSQSSAWCISNTGRIVGYARTAGDATSEAFLYENGTMTGLGVSGGTTSVAYAINSSGQIVGHHSVSTAYLACLFNGGALVDLGTLGGTTSYAFGINNSGQICGWSYTAAGQSRAFIHEGGVMTALGTLGGSESSARGINDAGQVVGAARVASGWEHAFLYTGGTMTDLGTLGGERSYAQGINNAGQVVGNYVRKTDLTDRAFLYSDGAMVDLNNLIDPASGWILARATAINDTGYIVGYGRNAAYLTRAYLLTPVPEPGTVSLTAIGLSALLARRRRGSAGRPGDGARAHAM